MTGAIQLDDLLRLVLEKRQLFSGQKLQALMGESPGTTPDVVRVLGAKLADVMTREASAVIDSCREEFSSADTDREIRANFDRQASATDSVSFLGLFQPKANKTVFFFVSFHCGATQSGILFLVSIE
ncbi:MAG: hypothetical protein ACHRXM_24785 [Isosphaerales bacterium]